MFDGALITLKQALVCIQRRVVFELSLTPTCPTPVVALAWNVAKNTRNVGIVENPLTTASLNLSHEPPPTMRLLVP